MNEQLTIKIPDQTFTITVPVHTEEVSNINNILLTSNTHLSINIHKSNNQLSSSLPLCSAFATSLRFYCPENLDLIAFLNDENGQYWIRHLWKLYYILTVIYRARWNKSVEDEDFVRVSSKILENVIGTRFAGRAIDLLLSLGIIETDNRYIVGQKCKGYRFKEPYESARFKEVKTALPERVISRVELLPKLRAKSDKLEHEYLNNNLLRVTIAPTIANFLEKFKPTKRRQADYYKRSVEWIQERHWLFCYDKKTGRVFNNITSFPKVMRPYLRLDGRWLVEIDVKNCQPFLLIGLYEGEAEQEEYQAVVQSGQFYEALDSELENPFGAERRKELKQKVFTQVFFDRIRPHSSKLCQAFSRRFPVLFEKLQALKNPHHRNCALWLQRREADIMIDGVIGKIARGPKFPVLTIHDSILTPPEFLAPTTELLKAEFQSRFGFAPKLETEYYEWSETKGVKQPTTNESKQQHSPDVGKRLSLVEFCS